MDVQATGASAAAVAVPPLPPAPSAPSAPAPGTPAVAVGPVSGTGSSTPGGAAGPQISSNVGFASLPPAPNPHAKNDGNPDDTADTVAAGVAKLYNAAEQNVSVSYQIQQNPNEIVMVFTDKQTGKVIVQFPSETMIALAKLFDKLDGNVVNKKV